MRSVDRARALRALYPRRAAAMALPLLLTLLLTLPAHAGVWIPAGDITLRHDIQRLADYGIIKGTTTSWPMAWGPVRRDISAAQVAGLPPDVAGALMRVKERADWETRTGELLLDGSVAFASNPTRIRSFQNTPRGEAELRVGAELTAGRLAVDANVQYVNANTDSQELRFDDSYLGFIVGDWSVGVSTQQRWWGPGWDGSLILSNAARPFPAVTIDRVFTDPFETKWLRWLGPWDLSVMLGQLEEDREIPNALFFGARFNFRPVPSLEIGVSRTALWCGDGRPCGLGTFGDLLLGRDNVGDAGIDDSNEPGNQLAGFDLRWTPPWFDRSVSLYGQFIGEDEAGGLPSQYMGQAGIEWAGKIGERWSARLFGEYARTTCDVFGASENFSNRDGFNCAYAHGTYQTGYRYRGRAIGHGADSDAGLLTVGAILATDDHVRWQAQVRVGTLNEGGPEDPRHTLTPTPQDIASIDISHSRTFRFGAIEIGAGYESVDDEVTSRTTGEARFFLQWRTAF